jgi:hypothetical protein
MTLSEYLQAGASQPFVWGRTDCCRWVCEWVEAKRGVDPAAAYRGSYDNEDGADLHLLAGRGLETLARRCMTEAGLSEVQTAQPGDVGVVDVLNRETLAIKTPLGWAVKTPKGIVVRDFPVLAAWGV